jgi:hypothetical protein
MSRDFHAPAIIARILYYYTTRTNASEHLTEIANTKSNQIFRCEWGLGLKTPSTAPDPNPNPNLKPEDTHLHKASDSMSKENSSLLHAERSSNDGSTSARCVGEKTSSQPFP